MKILICGAHGFVGSHLAAALTSAGHDIIKGVRLPRMTDEIPIDYCQDTDEAVWRTRLHGVDAVINAVGVLRDSATRPMSRLHDAAPRALFAAAANSGVSRIVQISALGVGSGIAVPYMQTKQRADDFLQSLQLDWTIFRPSLIYGADAAGTQLFTWLARLPLLFMPDAGRQQVQPIHIDDLTQAVVKLFASDEGRGRIIACVGKDVVSVADLICSYAVQMGGKPPRIYALPAVAVRVLCYIGDRVSALPLGSDTLAMLAAGRTANPAEFEALLGKPPKIYQDFIARMRG